MISKHNTHLQISQNGLHGLFQQSSGGHCRGRRHSFNDFVRRILRRRADLRDLLKSLLLNVCDYIEVEFFDINVMSVESHTFGDCIRECPARLLCKRVVYIGTGLRVSAPRKTKDVGILNKGFCSFYGDHFCGRYCVEIPHEVAHGSAVAAVKYDNGWAFALPNDVENHVVRNDPVFRIVAGNDNFVESVSFVSIHVAHLAAVAAVMDPDFLEFCALCDDGR